MGNLPLPRHGCANDINLDDIIRHSPGLLSSFFFFNVICLFSPTIVNYSVSQSGISQAYISYIKAITSGILPHSGSILDSQLS